jgi:hypothetical protein
VRPPSVDRAFCVPADERYGRCDLSASSGADPVIDAIADRQI